MQRKHKPNLTIFMGLVINSCRDGREGEKKEEALWEDGHWSVNCCVCETDVDSVRFSRAVFILISFLGSHTRQSVPKEGILCSYIWGLTSTLEHEASL